MFKEHYPESIHVSFYPYTYVRVMAMKGKLYNKQDYDKLLKMQGSDIAAYLENSDYKEDILALGKTYTGYTLVERGLYSNLIRNMQKLLRICSPEMNYLLRAYLFRHDIYNLKTILRGKAAGQKNTEIEALLLPLGTFSDKNLSVLLSQESMSSVLIKAGFTDREFAGALAYYDKEKSLLALENFLDKSYYIFLFTFLTKLAGEHQLFKELLQAEIDVLNVKLLLRLKKQGLGQQEISSFFFSGGALFSISKLHALAAKDFAGIVQLLSQTSLHPLVALHQDALLQQDLKGFEKSLDVWHLQKATLLLHQFPLSVDTLLGYMFAKEIEMRNLRVLVKGKQFGLASAFLEEQLVLDKK